MAWTVLFLAEVDEDLRNLDRGRAQLSAEIRKALLEMFQDPYKAKRMEDAIEGHARTAQIDRLDGTHFPQSFRLRVHEEFRATICLMPAIGLAIITHVFSKSSDPKYRDAVRIHEGRLSNVVRSFKDYAHRAGRT